MRNDVQENKVPVPNDEATNIESDSLTGGTKHLLSSSIIYINKTCVKAGPMNSVAMVFENGNAPYYKVALIW